MGDSALCPCMSTSKTGEQNRRAALAVVSKILAIAMLTSENSLCPLISLCPFQVQNEQGSTQEFKLTPESGVVESP